jgi:hypothetical protein
MPKSPIPAAGRAMPASGHMQSRQKLLAVIAGAPILIGAGALASANDEDAELLGLEAEIRRLHEEISEIEETRVWPHEEAFNRILHRGLLDSVTEESMDAASEFNRRVGREAACEEADAIHAKAQLLLAELVAKPARTVAGRAAKVRVALEFINDEWRGPADDLDWPISVTRQLLGEFAGLSEAELAAI